MTGSAAKCGAEVSGRFEVWDGYAISENLVLEPNRRNVQAWRTTDFEEEEADSMLEITLEPRDVCTLQRLKHSKLPADGEQYRQGWIEFYFAPMAEYFGEKHSAHAPGA
jgi:activator of HSP90 ATPase